MKKLTKIMFIARNIPTSKKQSNNVILRIANHLSDNYSVSFLYPKPFVPFGLNYLEKYKEDWKLKNWTKDNMKFWTYTFIWLPIKNVRFFLFKGLNTKIIESVFQSEKPEIIHAHYLYPDGILAYNIFKKYKIPYLITIRNSDISLIDKSSTSSYDIKIGSTVLKNASKILCLNKAQKDKIKNRFEKDCLIIPHGIIKHNIASENRVNYNDDVTKISCVAEAIPSKNIQWVINAVSEYNGTERIKLTIAGSKTKDLIIPEIIKDKSKVEIQLLGKVKHEDILDIMDKSQIFALPSQSESFGLVYLEAAANFNAIIGFKNQGVYGNFQENEEIFYPSDYESFKEILFSLIEDKKKQKKLAESAHLKVQSFTWENIIGKYNELYSNIIKTNSCTTL